MTSVVRIMWKHDLSQLINGENVIPLKKGEDRAQDGLTNTRKIWRRLEKYERNCK